MHRYKCWNGAMPTTAAQPKVAMANGVKTMLQLATPSTRQLQIISWGFSIDLAPTAAGTVELLQTDVGATITQHVAAGIQPLDPNAPASQLLIATTGQTGYTASAEGTTTASRVFDTKQIPIVAGSTDLTYSYQFMPDERPIMAISKFLRVRTTFGATTSSMTCWVTWDE